MSNKRKIRVSLAACISAILLAFIFDLLAVNGAISPITVDGKATGLGNPASVMEIIAVILVTYAFSCILPREYTKKRLEFTALISVIIGLSALGDYVLIHSHYFFHFPILLSIYFLVSISPFMGLLLYRFTVE